jgi:hypothetical protein
MHNGMIILDADGHALNQEPRYSQHPPEQFRGRQSIGGGGDGFGRRRNGRIPFPLVTVERSVRCRGANQRLGPAGDACLALSFVRPSSYPLVTLVYLEGRFVPQAIARAQRERRTRL